MPQYASDIVAKRLKEADRRYHRAMIAAWHLRGAKREAAERRARLQLKTDYQQALK